MKFSELPVGTTVLYTYQYTGLPLSITIGTIIHSYPNNYIADTYCSSGNTSKTSVIIMDEDDRATFIGVISSIDDAKSRFPEYFI